MVIVDVIPARDVVVCVGEHTVWDLLGLVGPSAAAATAKGGVGLHHGWLVLHFLPHLSFSSSISAVTSSVLASSPTLSLLVLHWLLLHHWLLYRLANNLRCAIGLLRLLYELILQRYNLLLLCCVGGGEVGDVPL
jgi:hypothetical protein